MGARRPRGGKGSWNGWMEWSGSIYPTVLQLHVLLLDYRRRKGVRKVVGWTTDLPPSPPPPLQPKTSLTTLYTFLYIYVDIDFLDFKSFGLNFFAFTLSFLFGSPGGMEGLKSWRRIAQLVGSQFKKLRGLNLIF